MGQRPAPAVERLEAPAVRSLAARRAGRQLLLEPGTFDAERAFEVPEDDDPIRWRIDPETRWDWERRLETRIEQFDGVDEAIREAVLAAEKEAMPVLRNLLVEAATTAVNGETDRSVRDMPETNGERRSASGC